MRTTSISGSRLVRHCMMAAILAGCAGDTGDPVDSAATGSVAATGTLPDPAAGVSPDSQDAGGGASLVVHDQGIGRLRAGMSTAEASGVVTGTLGWPPNADTTGCSYLQWTGGPDGVRVMVEGGRVVRIDVEAPTVATRAGARVGDAEDRVLALYGDRVTVTPHKYTEGKYLTVRPVAAADSAYRIVFETDSGKVVRFRSGRRPAVEYVEGCG